VKSEHDLTVGVDGHMVDKQTPTETHRLMSSQRSLPQVTFNKYLT